SLRCSGGIPSAARISLASSTRTEHSLDERIGRVPRPSLGAPGEAPEHLGGRERKGAQLRRAHLRVPAGDAEVGVEQAGAQQHAQTDGLVAVEPAAWTMDEVQVILEA